MAKTELTITIDERLAAAVKGAAESSNRTESEVVERALRSYYGLQNTIHRIKSNLGDQALEDEEADALALEAVKAVRFEQAKRL